MIYIKDKIEFQYVFNKNKIFIWDKKNDIDLPSYQLPKGSKELDNESFIKLCHYILNNIIELRSKIH